MTDPRTVREALIAQLLGDIDEMLTRVDEQKQTMLAITASLNEASDKYRDTIVNFTEQAKTELNAFLERRASEVASNTVEAQRAQLVAVVRQAFNDEASLNARRLLGALKQTSESLKGRAEAIHRLTAVVAGGFAALGYLLQPPAWDLFGTSLRLVDGAVVGVVCGALFFALLQFAARQIQRS